MPFLADRVQQASSTPPGTGPVTLGDPLPGFRTIPEVLGTQDSFPYTITDGSAWETGVGFLSSPTTLVRDEVHASSAGGAAVNFTTTARVFITPLARTLPRSVPGIQLGLKSLTRL